jgi:hypothetical protein
MARKITLFELHFDGARISPSFGSNDALDGETDRDDAEYDDAEEYVGDENEDDEYADDEYADETVPADDAGGSGLRRALTLVGTVAVFAVVGRRIARRLGGDADLPEVDVDVGAEDDHETAPDADHEAVSDADTDADVDEPTAR